MEGDVCYLLRGGCLERILSMDAMMIRVSYAFYSQFFLVKTCRLTHFMFSRVPGVETIAYCGQI